MTLTQVEALADVMIMFGDKECVATQLEGTTVTCTVGHDIGESASIELHVSYFRLVPIVDFLAIVLSRFIVHF